MDKDSGYITHNYKFSNYYKIRIFSKNKVHKEYSAFIKTGGWIALVEQDNRFFRLPDSLFNYSDYLQVKDEELTYYTIKQTDTYYSYFLLIDSISESIQDKKIHCAFKMHNHSDLVDCYHIQLTLYFKNANMLLTFNNEGCESNILL